MHAEERRARLRPALESIAGELTEAAYPVALRHGVKGTSVDIELDIWKALRRAVRVAGKWGQRFGLSVRVPPSREQVLANLTNAAYTVALRRGFNGPFVDLELDLWKTLGRRLSQVTAGRRLSELSAVGGIARRGEPALGEAPRQRLARCFSA